MDTEARTQEKRTQDPARSVPSVYASQEEAETIQAASQVNCLLSPKIALIIFDGAIGTLAMQPDMFSLCLGMRCMQTLGLSYMRTADDGETQIGHCRTHVLCHTSTSPRSSVRLSAASSRMVMCIITKR